MRTSNRGRKFPAQPLNGDEVKALLRACSKRSPTGVRNAALIATLYRTGLRIGEALSILPRDLDANAGAIRVLNGKGGTVRSVGMDPGAWALLQRWLDQRATLEINGHSKVFCTLRGEPLKTSYVRALLPRLASKAGVERRVHAHALRHSFAAELAAERTPMNVVQTVLGHANLATTDAYLRHINPVVAIETLRSRSWCL
ncbi:MAG: tyrosine-type recombinase/integrase [Planctomycetes bacterium]|nr:tyrosine-type recombinase/integrase [Planctomycetota bacterium]